MYLDIEPTITSMRNSDATSPLEAAPWYRAGDNFYVQAPMRRHHFRVNSSWQAFTFDCRFLQPNLLLTRAPTDPTAFSNSNCRMTTAILQPSYILLDVEQTNELRI